MKKNTTKKNKKKTNKQTETDEFPNRSKKLCLEDYGATKISKLDSLGTETDQRIYQQVTINRFDFNRLPRHHLTSGTVNNLPRTRQRRAATLYQYFNIDNKIATTIRVSVGNRSNHS
jgi:hypothetical protein